MAVYTDVDDDDLRAFLENYDLGAPISCKGIAEGVENSNFLLRTERGQYILTLYEKRVDPGDLPFFMDVLGYFTANGLTCPRPIADKNGVVLHILAERHCAIFSFLEGLSVTRPSVAHVRAIGKTLGQMHKIGQTCPQTRNNPLSVASWPELLKEALSGKARDSFPNLFPALEEALADLPQQWPSELPSGLIHGDFFPDNVFFLGENVSGVIDFYFACTDFLAYDLAIVLNAWCFERDGSLNLTKSSHFLESYERERPLTLPEKAAFPLLCQGAALRFLLTRLVDWLNTPANAFVRRKDPNEYALKWRFHRKTKGFDDYR
jgi:homoserine kinase type II